MNWLNKILDTNKVVYLPIDYCEGKTNIELVKTLKQGDTSLKSGMMIVNELLERIVNEN